jgi:hypothetical protein
LRAEKKTNNTGIGFCSHQCSCSGSQINSGRHGTPFIIPACFANNWLVTDLWCALMELSISLAALLCAAGLSLCF